MRLRLGSGIPFAAFAISFWSVAARCGRAIATTTQALRRSVSRRLMSPSLNTGPGEGGGDVPTSSPVKEVPVSAFRLRGLHARRCTRLGAHTRTHAHTTFWIPGSV